MDGRARWSRRRLLAVAAAPTGIDLNGKVFDLMGISPAAQAVQHGGAASWPSALPWSCRPTPPSFRSRAPGRRRSRSVWPDDPDQRKAREAKERERLHLAYCRGECNGKKRR